MYHTQYIIDFPAKIMFSSVLNLQPKKETQKYDLLLIRHILNKLLVMMMRRDAVVASLCFHSYWQCMSHVDKWSHAKMYSKIPGAQDVFHLKRVFLLVTLLKITKIIVQITNIRAKSVAHLYECGLLFKAEKVL